MTLVPKHALGRGDGRTAQCPRGSPCAGHETLLNYLGGSWPKEGLELVFIGVHLIPVRQHAYNEYHHIQRDASKIRKEDQKQC